MTVTQNKSQRIENAVAFMETELNNIEKVNVLALTTYALALAGSSMSSKANAKLLAKQVYNRSKYLSIRHVRYINILTWLRGFQDKLLYLVLFSLYPSLFWELRDKWNLKNYNFDPKAWEPCKSIDILNVAYCPLSFRTMNCYILVSTDTAHSLCLLIHVQLLKACQYDAVFIIHLQFFRVKDRNRYLFLNFRRVNSTLGCRKQCFKRGNHCLCTAGTNGGWTP